MTKIISTLLLSAIFILFGCGKGSNNQPNEEQKSDEKTGIKSMDDFVDNMKEVQKSMKEGQKYVDFCPSILRQILAGEHKSANERK